MIIAKRRFAQSGTATEPEIFPPSQPPSASLFQGKSVLDIGCGKKKRAGSIGLDQFPFEGVDIVANLESPLPILDETFDLVFADQVLEHVNNLTGLIEEIYRILKPGGQLVAHVPYFRSSWAHIDPTHVRSFTLDTLDYYVGGNWISAEYGLGEIRFSRIDKFIDFEYPQTIWRRLLTHYAIENSVRYENSAISFLFPFQSLSFVLWK